MRLQKDRIRLAWMMTSVLVGAVLAGCVQDEGQGVPAGTDTDGNTGPDGTPTLDEDPFTTRLDGPGRVFEPVGAESTVRLKLLQPVDVTGLAEGEQPVRVLLYDDATMTPVTDADFVMEARMPAMGHGTAPESAPVHDEHGVYEGMTTWSMPGEWVLHLDPQLADGTVLEFEVTVRVGHGDDDAEGMDHDDHDMDGDDTSMDGSMDHDGHDMDGDNASVNDEGGDHDGHGMDNDTAAPAFASYADAKAAPGHTYTPVNASGSTVHLKLLDPAHPMNATTGTQRVAVLLFDNATDAPLTNASFTIRAWMDDHDHGSSPEHAPEHDAHGVYVGSTTWSMAGNWTLHLDVTLADGSTLAFAPHVMVHAAEDHGDDAHHAH